MTRRNLAHARHVAWGLAAATAAFDIALVGSTPKPDGGRVALYAAALGGHALLALALRGARRNEIVGNAASGAADSEVLPRWYVAALVVVVALCAWLAPPRTSRDAFAYVAYGRQVGAAEQNPYVIAPEGLAENDPYLAAVDARWRSSVAVYGPAWVATSTLAATLGGDNPEAAQRWLRLFVLGAWILLLAGLAAQLGRGAVLLVGLWPVAVMFGVNDGHADLVMAAALWFAGWSLLQERWLVGGVCVGLACSVKVVAALPAALLLIAVLLAGRGRGLMRWVVGAGAVCLAVAAPFGLRAYVAAVGSATGRVSRASIWESWRLRWTHARIASGELGRVAGPLVRDQVDRLAALLMVVGLVALVATMVRRRAAPPRWIVAGGAAGLLFCVGAPYVLPWYLGATVLLLLARGASIGAWLWGGYLGLAYLAPWSGGETNLADSVLRLTASGWPALLVGLAALVATTWSFGHAGEFDWDGLEGSAGEAVRS